MVASDVSDHIGVSGDYIDLAYNPQCSFFVKPFLKSHKYVDLVCDIYEANHGRETK